MTFLPFTREHVYFISISTQKWHTFRAITRQTQTFCWFFQVSFRILRIRHVGAQRGAHRSGGQIEQRRHRGQRFVCGGRRVGHLLDRGQIELNQNDQVAGDGTGNLVGRMG